MGSPGWGDDSHVIRVAQAPRPALPPRRPLGAEDRVALVLLGLTAALAGAVRQAPALALVAAAAVEVGGLRWGGSRPEARRAVHVVAAAAAALGGPLGLTGYWMTDWAWTAFLAYRCLAAAHTLDRRAVTTMGWLTLTGAGALGVVTSTGAQAFAAALIAAGALGAVVRARGDDPTLRSLAAVAVVCLMVTVEREAAPSPGLYLLAAAAVPALLATIHRLHGWWHPEPAGVTVIERLYEAGWSSGLARGVVLAPTALLAVGTILAADGRLPGWPPAAAFGVFVVSVLLATLQARQRGHRGRPVLVVGFLILVGAAGAGGISAGLEAIHDMQAASDLARDGLRVAQAGELNQALESLDGARANFGHTHDVLAGPLGVAGRLVPGVGAALRATSDMTTAGIEVSDEARQAVVLLTEEDLTLEAGRVPLERVTAVADRLAAVDSSLSEAVAITERSIRDPWLSPAQHRIAGAREQLLELAQTTRVSRDVSRLVPALFGADGSRHYLLAVATPSELRGSGGLVGNFGELQAADGRVELVRLERIKTLLDASDPAALDALIPDDVADAYRPFELASHWQNLTAPADFTIAATTMEASYAQITGEEIDGTILVTPVALAAMLQLTGPIQVPGWPEALTSENAERILLLDQYVALDGDARELFLAEVATAIFDGLTSKTLPPVLEIRDILGPAVAAGHLRTHFARADEQDLSEELGADGVLPHPTGTDALTLVTQNASSSKIDAFLRRAMHYDVVWDETTGQLSGTVRVRLENSAPAEGLPPYVLGGLGGDPVAAGNNRMYVSIHTPVPVLGATLDGVDLLVSHTSPGGVPMATVLVTVPPRTTSEVRFVLQGQLTPGPYRLEMGVQPVAATDAVAINLRDPQGQEIPLDDGRADGGHMDFALRKPLHLTTR